MTTRVTNSVMVRQALFDLNQQRSKLASIQEQVSSGKRINRPSDDPVGTRNALRIRGQIDTNTQFDRNITNSLVRTNGIDSALDSSHEIVVRARELVLQAQNGTLTAGDRVLIAQEIEELHAELFTHANTRRAEGYIFAGYKSDREPFQVSGDFEVGQPAPVVTFVGDTTEVEVQIEENVTTETTLSGRRVFFGAAGVGLGAVPDAGKENVFDTLRNVWQALTLNDLPVLDNALARLDTAQSQLNAERVTVGAIEKRLLDGQDVLRDQEIQLTEALESHEGVDAARVISDLVLQETALQASTQIASRIIQPSLLDFLQ